MFQWLKARRPGPIGVDLGVRSVKLMQFNGDRSRLLAAARWELPYAERLTPPQRDARLSEAIGRARESQNFRGKEALLCLNAQELFVQNVRVPAVRGEALDKIVRQEAASRLSCEISEAEVRYLEAGEVRQGETIKQEVILMATTKSSIDRSMAIMEAANLRPLAMDAEPLAVARCYARQYRREDDRVVGTLYVHVGVSNTAVVITRGADVMFVKYIETGGRHLDESVARRLNLKLADAVSMRRYHGERRGDRQDPEISRTVREAIRPVVDRMASDVALCQRYFSVTFRGQKIERFVLSGGEASDEMLDAFQKRLNLPGELGNPFRGYAHASAPGRKSQWDVAAGLALWKPE